MQNPPVRLDDLVSELRQVEKWLTSSLGVSVDEHDTPRSHDPFAPPDELNNLKSAIDRIRPLLWVYITRQNEARELNVRQRSSGSRSLVEDTITLSDRYIGKND